VLKHDEVESAIQVEIDERVTRLAERYFPELCESNNDPRAQLLFVDGIKWMAECEPESLDIIIVDSTDPIGPAEGLFNEAFYQTCLKALVDWVQAHPNLDGDQSASTGLEWERGHLSEADVSPPARAGWRARG